MDNQINSQASTQGLRETQEVQSQDMCVGENDNVWGRLFAMQENVAVCNLINSSYTFGRGETDYRFHKYNFNNTYLPAISKTHFKLSRIINADLEPIVVIEDLSGNGTFVNKVLIGKGQNRVLQNNDEIALAHIKAKVFVFHDCLKNDDQYYPEEVTRRYTMTKILGEGSFGEVRLAYKQGTLEKCAIKIMKKKGSKLLLNNIKQIGNEIKLLQSVDHPFIIRLEDVIDTPEKIFIVMEAAGGGELFDRLVSGDRLPEDLAKFYLFQLGLAVQYLHSRKITHRDIKPENILLATDEEETCIKLTDFGLSNLAADTSQMTTFCGTMAYIAPELLEPSTLSYTKKVDLWSLGVVLYASLCCAAPFEGNDLEVRYLIRNAIFKFKQSAWKTISEDAKDLITKLLVKDPEQRYDVEQMLNHPWFQDEEMQNKVKNLLVEDSCSPSKKRRSENNDLNELELASAKTPRVQAGILEKL